MKTLRIVFVLAFSTFALAACASDGGGASDKQGGGSHTASYSAPPDGTLFADVSLDANEYDVRKLLGEPDRANAYMTGKAWIPFYSGGDVARTDWFYQGQGRVVFSRNRHTGALKVIRILYNVDEP